MTIPRLGALALTLVLPRGAAAAQARPVPPGYGVVRGRVLDPQGRPARGVIVQIATETSEVVPSQSTPARKFMHAHDARTDSLGRFSMIMQGARVHQLLASGVLTTAVAESLSVAQGDTLVVNVRMHVVSHAETPRSVRRDRLTTLAKQRVTWNARRPTRYRIEVKVECFCFGDRQRHRLEFLRDSLVAVTDSAGRRVDASIPRWKGFSIPALFETARTTIDDPERVVEEIVYDGEYGFPRLISSDTAYNHTDGWLKIRVISFSPVP